jgi:hypothetical protein
MAAEVAVEEVQVGEVVLQAWLVLHARRRERGRYALGIAGHAA